MRIDGVVKWHILISVVIYLMLLIIFFSYISYSSELSSCGSRNPNCIGCCDTILSIRIMPLLALCMSLLAIGIITFIYYLIRKREKEAILMSISDISLFVLFIFFRDPFSATHFLDQINWTHFIVPFFTIVFLIMKIYFYLKRERQYRK